MRVTSNSFSSTLLSQIGDLTSRQARLQAQAATGQRVQLPEDDPQAMQQALGMQAQAGALDQYSANIANLKDTTTIAYSAMKSLNTANTDALEIATRAVSVNSPQDLNNYASQIDTDLETALTAANTTFRGDYVFGGTKTDTAPFVAVRDANNKIVAVNYVGNSDQNTVDIGQGATSEGQPVGANTSGTGPRGLLTDSRYGADYFNHLIQLRDHLVAAAGDGKTVDQASVATIASTDQPNLKADSENVIYHYSYIGNIQSRLDAADSIAKDQSQALNQHISGLVDADLADTMVKLTQVQTAYSAALQSGGRILNTSLLDYLK
jgi:flagellar hook-associated protein 3 FlgL